MTSASAEVTRLRVAQAARVPVSADQVSDLLYEDEASQNTSAQKAQEILDEWTDAGLLERLPGDRYVHVAVFTHDLERRVCGHLGRPRTIASLQAECRADAFVGDFPADVLEEIVVGLVDKGVVTSLGEFGDADALADAVAEDEQAIDLHKDQDALLRERLSAKERAWQLNGVQFIQTRLGRDALQVL